MIVDAHQHFWDPERIPTGWLGPHLGPLNRPYGYDDLEPLLAATGVEAAVLVQAEDHLLETEYLLDISSRHEAIVGVVGWLPLDRPDEASDLLQRWLDHPSFCGVRNLIHQYADPDWLLRSEVSDGLGLLEGAGVPFDVVSVLPRHLQHVPVLSERHPELYMVIDHLSKPPIRSADPEPWWNLIARAAENPRVYAKVSGLYPDDFTEPSAVELQPFVDRALEVFGPDRLMFGSDWPVSVLSGGYIAVWDRTLRVLAQLGADERAAVLGGTATRFYALDRAATHSTDAPISSRPAATQSNG